MSHRKVQSLSNVAFSWENQPGISKAVPCQEQIASEGHAKRQLPLPPSPCAFRVNLAKKGSGNELDDPFLAAYMECTKSSVLKSQVKASGRRKKVSFLAFSCKNSFGFVEDAIVRMSELPYSKERLTRGHSEFTLGNSKEFKY